MVRDWLLAYLNNQIPQDTLVGWAREVKLEGAILSEDADIIGPALARIGVTGQSGYTLTWQDCFDLLEDLGFAPRVAADPISDDESG